MKPSVGKAVNQHLLMAFLTKNALKYLISRKNTYSDFIGGNVLQRGKARGINMFIYLSAYRTVMLNCT